MGLPAILRRYRFGAVLAALAVWLAPPALAAFCPCLAVVPTAQAVSKAECAPSCCAHCCTPAPAAGRSNLVPPDTARCPVLDQILSQQGGTLTDDAPVRFVGETSFAPVALAPVFSLGLVSLNSPSPGFLSTDFHPPRVLASLVARRCHPCNAPPVS